MVNINICFVLIVEVTHSITLLPLQNLKRCGTYIFRYSQYAITLSLSYWLIRAVIYGPAYTNLTILHVRHNAYQLMIHFRV